MGERKVSGNMFNTWICQCTVKIKVLNNGLKTQMSLCSSKKCLFLLPRYKSMVDQEPANKEHLVYRHNLFALVSPISLFGSQIRFGS